MQGAASTYLSSRRQCGMSLSAGRDVGDAGFGGASLRIPALLLTSALGPWAGFSASHCLVSSSVTRKWWIVSPHSVVEGIGGPHSRVTGT